MAPGNFTPSPEYPKIKQFSTGPKFDTRISSDIYQELFFEEYTFKKFKKQRKISNSEYLDRFKTYMDAATEFKPDLFFCDFLMNEACYDAAWKLKKPIVGISNGLTCKWRISYTYSLSIITYICYFILLIKIFQPFYQQDHIHLIDQILRGDAIPIWRMNLS